MRPTTPPDQGGLPSDLHRMVVLQPGEVVVCKIKHHPFGIIIQYVYGVIGIIFAAILVILLQPRFAAEYNSSSVTTLLYVVFAVLSLGLILMMAGVSSVYWSCFWIVTSDSLTQINKSSLFGTQVSELSLENLEDVTVSQSGIFAHMLKFGSLRAETAGDRSKFVFNYCPDPHEFARLIIDAREKFVQSPAVARDRAQDPAASTVTTS